MKQIFILCSLLLSELSFVCAQQVWHRSDSLLILPISDTVSFTDEYSVFAVLKSCNPDTNQLLWGLMSNDTLQSGFLTNAGFRIYGGVCQYPTKRDYSRWSVCYYHTGCRMDSADTNVFWVGATPIIYRDSILHVDMLPADIAVEELMFTPTLLPSVEAAAWQSYMAMKYGITLDLAPYVTPSGDTLWSYENDAEYYNRIVAIGTDSLHRWSADLSSSKENASLLLLSSDSLYEGEYMLLGDNDGTESWTLQADGCYRLLRDWRLRSRLAVARACSFLWTPNLLVSNRDSVWLIMKDDYGNTLERIAADSISGDTTYYFSTVITAPCVQLSVETTAESVYPSSPVPDYAYDASSGSLSLTMLDPDKVYAYALYTHVGQLLSRPTSSRPDCILVGSLPVGVYRLEAFDGNQMVASVPLTIR